MEGRLYRLPYEAVRIEHSRRSDRERYWPDPCPPGRLEPASFLGDDTLVGGLGADRFSFGPGSGADLILGFDQASGDRIDLQGQTYSLGQDAQGNALLILSGGGTIDLVGVTQGQASASFLA